MDRIFVIIYAFACTLFAGTAFAQTSTEDQVSAEILYNLVRFTEWPKSQDADGKTKYDICICEDDSKVPAIQELRRRSRTDDPVNIHILQSRKEIEEDCRVLYTSTGNYDTLDLPEVARMGVLTVSDDENFLNRGGEIVIARRGNKVGFSRQQNHDGSGQFAPRLQGFEPRHGSSVGEQRDKAAIQKLPDIFKTVQKCGLTRKTLL